jgi:hypothetical protein
VKIPIPADLSGQLNATLACIGIGTFFHPVGSALQTIEITGCDFLAFFLTGFAFQTAWTAAWFGSLLEVLG